MAPFTVRRLKDDGINYFLRPADIAYFGTAAQFRKQVFTRENWADGLPAKSGIHYVRSIRGETFRIVNIRSLQDLLVILAPGNRFFCTIPGMYVNLEYVRGVGEPRANKKTATFLIKNEKEGVGMSRRRASEFAEAFVVYHRGNAAVDGSLSAPA